MDQIGKFWAWVVGCCTIVLVVLISCITYYNVQDSQMMLRLAEMGFNPAIIECIDGNWQLDNVHDMCKMVLSKDNLTIDDAEKIVESLQE